ncbi:hypothetical protein KIN20_029520 [Parelaphostrongylus tenuis]|uniref:Uncharacterized protein n=1 Tax=Parelaphostrongylus tenuis TaxID=148309 RepID=A0AAD5R2S2_PARTN|nr:hypothetical protein KIN20_029520 [Parelaphostrongylus tenuis]
MLLVFINRLTNPDPSSPAKDVFIACLCCCGIIELFSTLRPLFAYVEMTPEELDRHLQTEEGQKKIQRTLMKTPQPPPPRSIIEACANAPKRFLPDQLTNTNTNVPKVSTVLVPQYGHPPISHRVSPLNQGVHQISRNAACFNHPAFPQFQNFAQIPLKTGVSHSFLQYQDTSRFPLNAVNNHSLFPQFQDVSQISAFPNYAPYTEGVVPPIQNLYSPATLPFTSHFCSPTSGGGMPAQALNLENRTSTFDFNSEQNW